MDYFSALFQDVKHKKLFLVLLSKISEAILKLLGFSDFENFRIKNLAWETILRQKH